MHWVSSTVKYFETICLCIEWLESYQLMCIILPLPVHGAHKAKLGWYTETKNKITHLQEGNNSLYLPHPTLSESSLRVYRCITGKGLFKQTDSVNSRSSEHVSSFAFPNGHALPGIQSNLQSIICVTPNCRFPDFRQTLDFQILINFCKSLHVI